MSLAVREANHETETDMDGTGQPPVSLLEISQVLEETARLVRQHADKMDGSAGPEDNPAAAVTAALHVRAIIAARRLRRQYLGLDATDAAWSMMLELYAARLEGRNLHQTGLSVAAAVPETTALRVTRRMLKTGIFLKKADPEDKRLLIICLSDAAAERIRAYLAAASSLAALAL
jgi:DNA-binding MarR family transcriptional regulator